LIGTYNSWLVALSVVIAAIASYTALDLAGRVSARQGLASRLWLLGGALSMGSGIWAMHFVGMLAFQLAIPLAYDTLLNLLSWLIAAAVSGVALFVVRRPVLTGANLSAGGALMGIGIASMHYTGMAAMRMSPPIQYDPVLFVASVMIAAGASLAALWLAFQLRRKFSRAAVVAKLGSALVMGLAIAGMHYTGMAAARFAGNSVCLAAAGPSGLHNETLAVLVGVATLGVLAVTLILSAVDAHFAAHTAKLADSLRSTNDQLRNVALFDKLTGLPNRLLLEDRLAQAAYRADRGEKQFALMFVDLDRFKPVNDRYGHAVGDALLRTVAQRLAGAVRKQDTVARTGGDEFVVVLCDIHHAQDAALVAGKVVQELARPFRVDQYDLAISCSIGISVYPQDGRDLAELMVGADAAMYRAKRAGASSFEFHASPLQERQEAP
jgi:diguanylate cyclase (GGDEF)-like protein